MEEYLKAVEGQSVKEIVHGIWETYDLDGNGVLDKDEAKQFLKDQLGDVAFKDSFD